VSHFAKVENGFVTDVIVAEQEFIDSGAVGDPSLWIQTSYNTRGGQHYSFNSEGMYEPDGTPGLRKNYAIIGGIYNQTLDAFYEQSPYPSWILDTQTCFWNPPIPCPNDGNQYTWNEQTQSWDLDQ
jgi:hypothetical protein